MRRVFVSGLFEVRVRSRERSREWPGMKVLCLA